MIFLTVGTLFSFDRLVKAVDEAVGQGIISDKVYAQLGPDAWKPRNMEWVEALEKEAYDDTLKQADALLSHAGMGSIEMAIKCGKPMLVMPRMKKYREHVNDHQVGTARKFEELGHVLAAYRVEDLPGKIEQLKTFVPKPRENQADKVAERIRRFLEMGK